MGSRQAGWQRTGEKEGPEIGREGGKAKRRQEGPRSH